ncbi:MAG: DNA polymerase III subunit alpha [bacterium]
MPTDSSPPGFVHLHTHSHFSLLDGAGKVDALIAKAKELGMDSLALTDHGAMYGIVEFYEKCKKAEIKPILGVEAYMARRGRYDRDAKLDAKPYHQILLCETYAGYLNLLKMISEAHLNGFYYKPRIDKELLKAHSKGLIATSSCLGGEIPRRLELSLEEGKKALEEYLEIFGTDHFFLELQPHDMDEQRVLNDQLKRLASEYKVGLIATNDIHYIEPEDAEAQDVLVCVSSGKTVNDPNRLNMTAYDLSMKTPEDMAEIFKDTPEAITNTVKIAERCDVKIPMGENILPVFPLPEGTTDRTYLRELCAKGVKERYGFDYVQEQTWKQGELLPSPPNDPAIPLPNRVARRLEYELSVIEKMGYESYFLITQDFINWARSQDIMIGPGRGSAAGSIVSYLVHIINLDPLHYNLIFERFLNPERIGMPDIDNDIEAGRRDEVIAYVRERYGADRVAQIITFGTMLARNAIRDVGRALGVSYGECDYIAKLIPSGPGGMTLKEAMENIQELKDLYSSNEQLAKLIDIASRLEGVARHTSIHAAGVVITKEPLTSYVPLQRSVKDDNAIVTQYAMNQVEHLGLLKIDFLGLSNLDILQQALRVIKKTRGVQIDLDHLPIDDKETYELLSRAESTGVFQLESSGMKRYLKELKPSTFEDILSMVALYRPGPMDAIPDFIESKHGRKEITYLHPILEPILSFTYGVIVTQDQVLEVARKFAGFSYAEADILRKAVGKKIKALLDEQRDKFINGAVATHESVNQAKAEEVWNFIEPFARYGFNRAHAACYAMIAYQTAYLKAHYPVEFMSALLTSDINNLDRIGIEIAECKERGIEVLAPDVNESFVEFGVVFYPENEKHQYDSYVRFGLGAIKNVGLQPAEAIVAARKADGPFKDFSDFLKRCAECLNKKVVENLAMAGAFDSLAERQQVIDNLEIITRFTSYIGKQRNSSQASLFDDSEDGQDLHELHLQPSKPADQKTRLAWERELLGIYISDHPISSYMNYLPEDRVSIAKLHELENNTIVRVSGVVMTMREILTKTNQSMAFVGLEDDTGAVEAVVFPRTWADKKKYFVLGDAVTVEAKISRGEKRRRSKDEEVPDEATEEVKLLVDDCVPVSDKKPATKKRATRVQLEIPESGDRGLLQKIKEYLEKSPGNVPVTLMIPTLDGTQPLTVSHKVEPAERLYVQLAGLLGADRVTWE